MYKTINGWTKSQLLKVIKARRYNAPAVGYAGICEYSTANGNRCAIGMFIPSGHHGLKLRGTVTELLGEYPDLKDIMPLPRRALVKFQGIHDSCSKPHAETKNAKQAMIQWVKANVK